MAIASLPGYGGYSVDNPTLTRFFTLHYLIPFLILGLFVLHIWALHVPGNNNPIGIDIKKPSKDTVSFHPYIVIKDLFALLLFMILFAFFVFYSPNVLGHADNYIEANPLVTPAHIVPEWYLLPFYAILRSVPDKLLGVVAMFASIFILIILPWLDTSKIRSAIFNQFINNILDFGFRCTCSWVYGGNACGRYLFINSKSSYSVLFYSFFGYSTNFG